MSVNPILEELKKRGRQADQNSAYRIGNVSGYRRAAAPYVKSYSDLLNERLQLGLQYAQQGPEYKKDLADSISPGGAMTAYKKGDISAFDWDTLKQAEMDRVAANTFYRSVGAFDNTDYAFNKGYVHLASTDYLKSLLPSLEATRTAWNSGGEEDYLSFIQRNSAVKNKLADMDAQGRNYYDTDALTEADLLWFDQIINGNERWRPNYASQEDVDRYNSLVDQWASVEDWENFDLAQYLGIEAPKAYDESNYKTIISELERRAALEAMQADIRSNANYSSLSAYSDPGITPKNVSWAADREYEAYVKGYDDLSRFINSSAVWSELMTAADHNATVREYMSKGYDYISADELADYNALINAGRTEEATQYLELLLPELQYRRAMVLKEYQSVKATNPWLAAPTWVEAGLQGIANVFYLPQQIYETATGKDTPWSSAWDAYNKQQWTGEAQIGAIHDADIPDWLKTVSTYAYQGVTSFRDNAMRILAGGGSPTASLIIAGLQSGSGSLHESSERDDMSGAAKIIKAIGTAAVEMGTEKVGLDALFSKGKNGALAYMKNVILSEVGEEVLNAASEPVLESVVAFLFDHEADIMSGPEFWKGLTDTAITTAISSVFMGGGGAISNEVGTRSIGRDVTKNGDLEGVLRIADSYSNKSEVSEPAKKIRDKQAKGFKVSNRDVGELVTAVSSAIGEKNSKAVTDVLDTAIGARLEELGEAPENAKKLAPAIRNVYQGKKLTMAERASLKWTNAASQVLKEMNTETQGGDKQRVGHSWKTDAGTELQAAQRDALLEETRFTEALNTKTSTTTAVGKAHDKAKNLMSGKPKMATREVMAEGSDGKEVKGTFERVERENGKLLMVMKDASDAEVKVDADKITNGGDEGILTIINYAQEGARHEMSTDEVNTMVNTYLHEGGDVDSFVQQFQDNYLSGYSGVNAPAGTISSGIASIAYEQGKAEAIKDEADRVSRAQKARKVENPSVGWLGDVTSDTSIKGLGDTDGLNEAVKNMTTTQQAMVEFGRHLAKSAKINVVFFASKAGEDGKFATQNGSYDPNTHTIYLDINSGASTESGRQELMKSGTLGAAIGRVAGHELTHVLEATSPEYYGKYKQAVKAALKAKNLDYASLVREKIDAALASGNKLTYAGAEAEVIADASEYMLQDSKFVKNMDQGLKGKVKEIVQKFLNKVNEAFRMLKGGHIESAALRTMTDGVAHYEKRLQDLWDMAFDEMLGAEVKADAPVAEATGETETVQKSRERDDAYMAAVERGDMVTAQKMADEAAERAMPNSKIRDTKGKLLKVYHGTRAEFNVFDTSKQGGTNGTAEGFGIYLSDSQEVTNAYGQRQIGAYANITKPATSWAKTITVPSLARLIEATCKEEAKRMMAEDGYSTINEALPDTWISNYVDTYTTSNMSAHYRNAASQIVQMNDSDMSIIQEAMVGMGIRDYDDAENFYDNMLTPATGFDGFWTTWDNRNTGEKNNIILALRSSQIKLADPVTYDDSGNVIPLSERFNAANEDIRYSHRDDGSAYHSEAMTVADGMQGTDGKRMFSLRSFNEDYDTYRAMLMNHNVPLNEINDLFDTIDEVMKAIEKDREILDFGWNVGREDRSFNPVKPNSDPLYEVSLDFSTLCRKRLLQQTVQERLEAMYDTVLTKAERVAIRNELMKLREEGKQIEVACALCYVESTRLKSPAQIQRFFDDRRAVMVDYFAKKNKTYMKEVNTKADELIVKFVHEPGTKKKELNSFQKKAVENLKQSMYKKYTPSEEEEAIIATALELPGESFKTDRGLWNLKKEHEEIFDAYTSFVRNATKSKGIEGDEAWWAGDSKSISDKLIEKMNKENGLRTQSWSDFQVIHLLDYVSAIIELSTRGAKMQSYTKVPDFVKLMGDTGVMINLSLIPKGFDGTLNYDPIEGMPIEEALALREMFPNTAGTICIGITDKHIRMLLADPNTDYVIPYHSSSLDKKTRQQMGMKVWEDFQSYQNEKNKDYPNTVDDNKTYRKKPLFSEWFDYNTVSERAKVVGAERAMQEAADRYIELCHRRGLQEKFAQFAAEPNYWKLLIDRKMINQQTGEIIKQEAVQPRFNKDRILDILSAEVNRFKAQNADKDAAVEHIVNAWENGEIRKAAKSKKVRDQVSAFNDTVTVANIVASAAELDAQEQTQKSIRDLPEDTVTYRDYLTEADSSIAATIEERNALSIYQKLLKNHAEASEKVIEAEAALAAADEAHKPEARKALAAARVKQKDLYNRLLNVERQAHVQTLVKRSNQIIGGLYGKDQAELDKMLADKERRIASLKADLTGLKGAVRTQREADIREQEREVAALKSKATKALLANSERYQRQIDEIRLRRDLNIEIGKRTRHIKRIVKRLNDRIIHEEDYKNVKEPLKPAVIRLVKAFIDGFGNLVFYNPSDEAVEKGTKPTIKARENYEHLKSLYDKLADDDGAPEFYSDDVANWLTTLAELARQDEARRTSGSTLENLNDKLYIYTTLSDIVDHVAHMVTAADTMFIEGKKAEASAVTEEVGNTLAAKKDRRELAGWAGKLARFADNLIVKGNMMPQFFFEGLNNKGMMRLYDDLQNGVRKYSERMLVGDEFLSDAMRRHGYHTWDGMKKPVSFKTKQGHTIYLTRENMMWIYATAKREASNPMMDTHHLDEGGITYEEIPTEKGRQIEGKGVHHLIVAEDVAEITKMLTAEQIAYVDECVEFLSTECAEWGNEASLKLFGIKKYKEGYYFPFKVDSGQLHKSSAAGATSTVSDARVKHISFSHSIKKGANTPLVMGNFTSVIADHINQMATYSGMVVPIENMNRVLNRKVDDGRELVNIRSLIARKHGDNTSKYIDDLLKDLNGGPQTDNRGSLDAGLRLFKRNAVVGKLSVALQQPTAVTRAFAYISPRWFANLHLERPKHTWDRMMKYSSTTFLKDMGGFNVGMGKGASNWLERGDLGNYRVYKRAKFLLDQKSFKDAVDEWNDFLTGLPGFMDKITWCAIWNATENEQAHQHPSMDRNSDEFLELVGRRFDDIVNHTQVYDSILSKSQNMRSKNAIAKMATSFMAESTLNMNLAYRAIASKDGKQITKVTASLILNAVLGAAAYALIGAFNKDDDDRTLEEKYATAFAGRLADNLNPLASIPYLSDLWNKLQGYDVERTDLSFLFDLIEDGGKFWNKMTDPEETLSYRDYENFVGGLISTATGIPAKNWMGDARRIWNMTHTSTADAPFSSVWYGILDEVVPGRESTSTAYYERYLSALRDGDKQEQYDLKEFLTKTKGTKEDAITEGVRNAYKTEYQRGGIDKQTAIKFLLDNNLVSGETADKKKQKAFQFVDKWDEGTEGYSAYNTLTDALAGGNTSSIQTAWKELTSNGYNDKQVKTQVKTLIKELVQEKKITAAQATTLLKKWSPYEKDKDNQNKPLEWLKENK